MTTFAAGNRHFEAYMLRLFPPAVALTALRWFYQIFYINLRKNNIFIFDIYLFIKYKLKYPKK